MNEKDVKWDRLNEPVKIPEAIHINIPVTPEEAKDVTSAIMIDSERFDKLRELAKITMDDENIAEVFISWMEELYDGEFRRNKYTVGIIGDMIEKIRNDPNKPPINDYVVDIRSCIPTKNDFSMQLFLTWLGIWVPVDKKEDIFRVFSHYVYGTFEDKVIPMFISKRREAEFDSYISKPPIVMIDTPKVVVDEMTNAFLDMRNETIKMLSDNSIPVAIDGSRVGHWLMKDTIENLTIRREDPIDGDVLNKIDLDTDSGLSPEDCRKRIKYAKSYQERKYYNQMLNANTIPKRRNTKSTKKKKKR